jgi:hypothetical protein
MTDKLATWKARPYSWSQHSSWDWDKEGWFRSYVLGERGESSSAMAFGNVVGASIATDEPLSGVPRRLHMEYEVRAKLGKVELLGFFDSYGCGDCFGCIKGRHLEEYKTSANPNKWTQQSVDAHGQLTYYCMLLYLRDKVPPESVGIRLHYIPVAEGNDFSMSVTGPHKTFSTRRTTAQVFELMKEITKRRRAMEVYARKHLEMYDPA